MATLRQWLNEAGFQWDKGRIVYHDTGDNTPGWSEDEVVSASLIGQDHPVLDREFYAGFGGPECPRFVAEDDTRIFFPRQYDGATALVVIHKDLDLYLDPRHFPTPYPGGG